jgi:hypothetical protein
MKLELVVEFALEVSLAKHAREPRQKNARDAHDDSPAGFANRATISDMRVQFSASFESCFRPAAVIA